MKGTLMSDKTLPRTIEELSHDQLVQTVLEGFRRTLVHFGLWHREVEHQLGMHNAMEIESAAGDQFWKIMLPRLAEVLGFEVENGVPKALNTKSREELLALIKAASVNWLVNDGVWFQAVENRFGMNYAKCANDTAWTRFSPYEATRIKKMLGLSDRPGLEGLKAALGHRLYAAINVQSIEDVVERSFIFRMNECRVQNARKRRGLDDYPCKSGGLVEYTTFAETIDPRIKTECIGCPPDPHPPEWFCAWRFTLVEQ
jgi:hypothetical protein